MDKARELIEMLGKTDDYFERQKAAWALVNLGEGAVDQTAKALETGEFSDLRYKSAWILGKIFQTSLSISNAASKPYFSSIFINHKPSTAM